MAQTEANIANTSVQLKGDKVQIKYDILNTDKAAWFIVSVAISDSDGNRLDVNALDGDIGEVLKAGKNKVIVWDPVADSIFLNATIDIQVYAEMVLPPQIIEPEPEIQAEIEDNKPSEQDSSNEYFAEDENQNEKKSKKDNEEVESSSRKKSSDGHEFNRTAILLQSVALPGLGLSRVTKKPHWIKGVAGYGCIAGAIVFNKKAVSSYNDYSAASSPEEANSLFSTTTTQNTVSQGLAFTAIAIWIADLTWTFIGTKDLKKSKSLSQNKGISIDVDYDMKSNTPLLSLNYTF